MLSTFGKYFFPIAVALIMFGLGLTLKVRDFTRIAQSPRAVIIALTCQIILLPAVCLGLVLLLGMDTELAVGMMLLAATPGGATANLLSHIAGGDVALNVSLTAINSILAIFTMPVVTGLAVSMFLEEGIGVGLQADKLVQVSVMIGIPVVLGMWIARRWPAVQAFTGKPLKVASALIIVLGLVVAVGGSFRILLDNLLVVGTAVLAFCTISVVAGYWIPRLFGVNRKQSVASSMEIGVHNGGLALAVAYTVLANATMAIPAAVYGVLLFIPVGVALFVFTRRSTSFVTVAAESDEPELAQER